MFQEQPNRIESKLLCEEKFEGSKHKFETRSAATAPSC